jgi:hypothetical protein
VAEAEAVFIVALLAKPVVLEQLLLPTKTLHKEDLEVQ